MCNPNCCTRGGVCITMFQTTKSTAMCNCHAGYSGKTCNIRASDGVVLGAAQCTPLAPTASPTVSEAPCKTETNPGGKPCICGQIQAAFDYDPAACPACNSRGSPQATAVLRGTGGPCAASTEIGEAEG